MSTSDAGQLARDDRRADAASKPRVAVAIPAYNEAGGIAGFLEEIDRALTPLVASLTLVVVDDASTDDTAAVVRQTAVGLGCSVELIANERNRGHGPSLVAAYRRTLEGEPNFVLQVDGDGQFHGNDLRRVLVLLLDEAHAVCGVRRFRQDTWFRMAMTRVLREYLRIGFSVRARDGNCPLRGYESALLGRLLQHVADDCRVPNLYLTVLAARRGSPLLEVDVSHRVRRGEDAGGTTWGTTRSPIPWRLLRFSAGALRESIDFRRQVRQLDSQQGSPAPTQTRT